MFSTPRATLLRRERTEIESEGCRFDEGDPVGDGGGVRWSVLDMAAAVSTSGGRLLG